MDTIEETPANLLELLRSRSGMMYINHDETAMYVQWNSDVILMIPGDYRGMTPDQLNLHFQAAMKKD